MNSAAASQQNVCFLCSDGEDLVINRFIFVFTISHCVFVEGCVYLTS